MSTRVKGIALLQLVKALRIHRQRAEELLDASYHVYLRDLIALTSWYPEEDHVALVEALVQILDLGDEDPWTFLGRTQGRADLSETAQIQDGDDRGARTGVGARTDTRSGTRQTTGRTAAARPCGDWHGRHRCGRQGRAPPLPAARRGDPCLGAGRPRPRAGWRQAAAGRPAVSRFHRAIHISYPNEADLERAFEAGVDPGGAIFLHGTPDPTLLGRDWTNGCIAVSNRDIDLIWQLVPDGTPITIRP